MRIFFSFIKAFILLFLIGATGYAFIDHFFTKNNIPTLSTPGPLRGLFNQLAGTLTPPGIVAETNKHRQENNASVLKTNSLLQQAAEKKVDDMAEKQYFEHVSPQGVGIDSLEKSVGYEYVTIGENLALGNFTDDQAVVDAWMNSPGHRANILSEKFTEIGVAAKQVPFEGHTTWMAVQEFGRPASDCPAPPTTLQKQFDSQESQIKSLNTELNDLKLTLDKITAEINTLAEQGNKYLQQGNVEIEKGNEIYQQTGSQEQAQPHWDKGKQLQNTGNELLAQAREKESQLQELQNTYNSKLAQAQKLDRDTQALVTTLNQKIHDYNACISK